MVYLNLNIQNKTGTSFDDIYSCIRWLCCCGKDVVGGRNFSVVHDAWDTKKLKQALLNDINMYKLRRYGNESDRSV